jgi:hypothetical protein
MLGDYRMDEEICLSSVISQDQSLLSSHLLRAFQLVQTHFEILQTVLSPKLMSSWLKR